MNTRARPFQTVLPTAPELKRLLDEARVKGVTEDELRAQRVGFALWDVPLADRVTKDSVQDTARNIRRKAP